MRSCSRSAVKVQSGCSRHAVRLQSLCSLFAADSSRLSDFLTALPARLFVNGHGYVHGLAAAQQIGRSAAQPGKPRPVDKRRISLRQRSRSASNGDRLGHGGCGTRRHRASRPRGLNAPVLSPSRSFEGVWNLKNCARNQCWRGFQRIVTTGKPVVTMLLPQTNCRRNAGIGWRRDRAGRGRRDTLARVCPRTLRAGA